MGFCVVLLIVVATAAGDYFLKLASARESAVRSVEFGFGSALYVISALGFVYAMRHMTLATLGVWYALLTVLFMAALGVFVFGESLAPRELAGIAMAVGAICLMTRVI